MLSFEFPAGWARAGPILVLALNKGVKGGFWAPGWLGQARGKKRIRFSIFLATFSIFFCGPKNGSIFLILATVLRAHFLVQKMDFLLLPCSVGSFSGGPGVDKTAGQNSVPRFWPRAKARCGGIELLCGVWLTSRPEYFDTAHVF